MLKKYLLAEELAEKMKEELQSVNHNKSIDNINQALNILHSASEILLSIGLTKQSKDVNKIMLKTLSNSNVMQKFAKKRKEKDLDSRKMLKNLSKNEMLFDLSDDNDDYKNWLNLLDKKSQADDFLKLDDNIKSFMESELDDISLLDLNDVNLEIDDIDFEDED